MASPPSRPGRRPDAVPFRSEEQLYDCGGTAARPPRAAAATVLRTARELLRHSYYCYEFSTVAVMHSLIAVEIVLRDRIPGAGTKPLFQLIKQGADAGTLTVRQAECLDYGRQIRNGMAHGKTTHAVMPPGMAVPMVTTSFAIVTELCLAHGQQNQPRPAEFGSCRS
ncbi:hypothetical protein ACFCX0_49230 [Streptomyces sp. NPDC056352]|uniref:hypothetical protein n=1 Tax=Streptomyces sp. NPDC056352 TaxID=3345791 RepID=UPI0035D75588